MTVEGRGARLETGNTQVLVVNDNADFTARDLVVGPGVNGPGSALHCGQATARLEGVEITGHDAPSVVSGHDCDLTLHDTVVHFNRSTANGGAVTLEAGSHLDLGSGSALSDNSADGWGGAVMLQDSTMACADATLHRNSAQRGGHVAILGAASSLVMQDCATGAPSSADDGAPYDFYVDDGTTPALNFIGHEDVVTSSTCAAGVCGERVVVVQDMLGGTYFENWTFVTHYPDHGPATYRSLVGSVQTVHEGVSCTARGDMRAEDLRLLGPAVTVGPASPVFVPYYDVGLVIPNDGSWLRMGWYLNDCTGTVATHPTTLEYDYYILR